MKVTVCELPNEMEVLQLAWEKLVEHTKANRSKLVLLPEMPFAPWVAETKEVNAERWQNSVRMHEEWIKKLSELGAEIVVSTRPVLHQGIRYNAGYVWSRTDGLFEAHTKYYLPDDPGFWEATWYSRGNGEFSAVETSVCKIGMLICTEIWFNKHAREYGKEGIHLLLCPRATERKTVEKWIAGGRTAAVVSGAYCLSSNLAGGYFGGAGWIIEPDEANVLGVTSSDQPFLTLDIDLTEAENAKKTYPRYVPD